MAIIRKTRADRVFDAFNIAFMVLILILMAYPLYFTVIAALSEPSEVVQGNVFLYPKKATLEAFQNTIKEPRIWIGYRNTLYYTVCGTLLNIALTVPAGYVMAKKKLPGRMFFTTYFLLTMYIGGGMIPTYINVKSLGLINQPYTLVVLSGLSVYNLIVTRVFFQTSIPDELYESAYIDGASEFRGFFTIALPLAKAIIAVMALFYGVSRWNEFMQALIYVSKAEYQPLQMVLRSILLLNQSAMGNIDAASMDEEMARLLARRTYMAEAMKYALIFIASAPLLIAYPFVQKHFVKGVMIGSLKG